MVTKNLKLYTFFISIVIGSLFLFKNNGTMGINWSFPYFSGSANLDSSLEWRISPEDYEIVKDLASKDYPSYKHLNSERTLEYGYGNFGYVLVARIARMIFGTFGDINSILILQFIIHLIISIFVLEKIFVTRIEKYSFILLYSANPLIIHFVSFPFYYFWTVLPSLIFLLLISYKDKAVKYMPLITLIALLSFFIRPTSIFLIAFLYLLAFIYAKKNITKIFVLSLATIFLIVFLQLGKTSSQQPWHTMYIGIGAYENNFGVYLSDHSAYDYYKSQTDIQMSSHPIEGTFNDTNEYSKYSNKIKERYLHILQESPFTILRNAMYNFPIVYSIGYVTESKLLTFISFLIGLIMLSMLIISKQWTIFFGIFFSAVSFFWYFPPIPAYNFGAYILLVIGLIRGFKYILKIWFGVDRFFLVDFKRKQKRRG